MKKQFSKEWKSSTQPRKQRKFIANAPLHIRNRFVSAHLSKDLIKKHSRRSVRLRIGDKTKVMRGQFKGKAGKIERIDPKYNKVYISGLDFTKKDGSKAFYPIHPSNLLVTDLNLADRRRMKKAKEEKQKPAEKKEPEPEKKKKPEERKK